MFTSFVNDVEWFLESEILTFPKLQIFQASWIFFKPLYARFFVSWLFQ